MQANHIILTGFMGSGKTSVGRVLAANLNIPFIDIDELIENDTGKPIREIFRQQGEEYFRDIESKAISKAIEMPTSVIATGGGALMQDNNLQLLRKNGSLIYLQAEPETLWERVRWNENRPLLEKHSTLEAFTSLLQQRIPNYKKSSYIIDVDHLSIKEVADCIIELIKE